ncbi:MAG: helix-hairpin-helix domain-containing protein [Anaerolineales bacterium]|nr:helix-hairpin-helix domain-containing protein [Anaerolineales bacterium]
MSRFLDFLNNADLNTLTQVPGISRPLAGNLIAARPFDSEEDCLQVKGMGQATMERLQSHVEALEEESVNSAMVPVENEAMPAPVEKKQPEPEEKPQRDSFFKRLGRAFKSFMLALLKLIMLAILFVAIGALFAVGLPYLQRTFIAPVERNASQIQELQAEVDALQAQVDDMNSRVAVLEGSVEAHTASIQKLEEMQATLDAQLQENNDTVLIELKQEVMLTRALDILGRARLYLSQSNFGMAKADIQTARDLLAELQAEKNDPVLKSVLGRLDLSLGNLPDFPVIAAGDLEIAWQILITGNTPPPTATMTATPTPAPLEETLTPSPEVSPTIEATATP